MNESMPSNHLNTSIQLGLGSIQPPTYNTLRRPRDSSYCMKLEQQLNDKDETIMKLKAEFF